jgi:hypothetical protein
MIKPDSYPLTLTLSPKEEREEEEVILASGLSTKGE